MDPFVSIGVLCGCTLLPLLCILHPMLGLLVPLLFLHSNSSIPWVIIFGQKLFLLVIASCNETTSLFWTTLNYTVYIVFWNFGNLHKVESKQNLLIKINFFFELTWFIRPDMYMLPGNELFFLPVTISRTRMPKLYVSDFAENKPRILHSGAIYPLH